ncbi:hypothetical protein DDD63_02630 [Actinobaculum sp. 313]|nr:hypothetical protein DDD63_02630 [Actinobaculum sp. 313]
MVGKDAWAPMVGKDAWAPMVGKDACAGAGLSCWVLSPSEKWRVWEEVEVFSRSFLKHAPFLGRRVV